MKDNIIASLLIVVALLLGVETWSGEGGVQRLFAQKELLQRNKISNRQLANDVQDLKGEVQALATNPRYQEKAIRSTLGMARENEIVFFFSK